MKKKNLIILIFLLIFLFAISILFFLPKERPIPSLKIKKEVPKKEIQKAPPPERYEFQGIKYEIIGKVNNVYDIITGKLEKEKINLLAQKIIKDVLVQNPNLEKITLKFYQNLISAGKEKVDVAEILWEKGKMKVKIIE